MSDTDKDTNLNTNSKPHTPTITNITTTTLTTTNDSPNANPTSPSSDSQSKSKSKSPQISPPEIPSINITNDTSTSTTSSSYAPVTGQSQTVSTQRHNPISSNTNTVTLTTENKIDEQTLLNQYAYHLPSTNVGLGGVNVGLSGANVAALASTGLGRISGVGGLGAGGVGIGATGVGLGGNAAQQYLLYNQLNNYNATLLRAQLMAQRTVQLQTLSNTNSQQWVLFVFHLPEDMDDNGLLLLFSPFGATQGIVMRHKNTDCSRGFGFVHFRSKNDAQIAIDMMNGYQIGHKRLRVSFKKSKE